MTPAEKDVIKVVENIIMDVIQTTKNDQTRRLFFVDDILVELRRDYIKGAEKQIKKYYETFNK